MGLASVAVVVVVVLLLAMALLARAVGEVAPTPAADLRRAGTPLRLIALRTAVCGAVLGGPCLVFPLDGPGYGAWLVFALTLAAGVGLAGLAERRAALQGAPAGAAVVWAAAAGTGAALLAGLQTAYASALSRGGPTAALDLVAALLEPGPAALVLFGGGALAFLLWGVPCAYVTLGALTPGPMRQADASLLPCLFFCVPVPGVAVLEGCYALALRLEGLSREDAAVDEVLHITTREAWAAAEREGRYAPASLASEGFVHLSSPAQLAGTAARYYAGQRDLVVLVLDAARLEPDLLRWEVSTGGERFPHLYRAIDPAEVLDVRPLA
ncbi:MAG: DUF952 domain-containing protein [Planctomycetes bacterium]|nr:DUF952 domain-containing protein [Planctomycetota bacterium]